MGTSCCIILSDWIEIAAIVVNALVAWWIVRTIQNRLTNNRVLKDHFIEEIKDIRNEYRNFLNNIYASKTEIRTIIPWFKLMNIRVSDLMTLVQQKYNIDKQILSPYQIDLRELVTESDEFNLQFREGNNINFSESTKTKLIEFQNTHNHLFNELIININDTK